MRAMAGETFLLIAGPEAAGGVDFRIGDLPPAEADAAMMGRVWANLLSNAVKYSGPSAVHSIEVGGYLEGGMNLYFVRDRGVGFDQRYADKLFGMFNRLHGEREFSGSGVGLAIVKKIISRHGGTVRAEGRLGEGSTFYFSIPKRS
jgi:light-regulated signal transduction histidine kinase (bacteriophytochrome)